ncbi:MAG: methionine--tRNA ligase, partial [Alphaproteobacteria bacterium]|nr:methionine--tRNA ligase [Alphaproteobacteria bacterium]
EKFDAAYNNELANDLGNLVQRLSTLAAKNNIVLNDVKAEMVPDYCGLMEKFEFNKAFDLVWEKVQSINREIDEEKPWMLAKNEETDKLNECMSRLINELLSVNLMLEPFMPNVSERIKAVFENPIVPPETPLFPKQ